MESREDFLRGISPEEKNFADFQEMLNNINAMGGALFIKEEDIFRLQILIIHLFVDNLLEEIIRWSPVDDFRMYKKRWSASELPRMGFYQKLEIVMSTGKFDAGFKEAIVTLNDIRNDLAHTIKVDLIKQKIRIEKLKIEWPFKKEEVLQRPLLEQLEISIVPYINVLFEYLIKEVKKKKLNFILGVTTADRIYPGGSKNIIFTLGKKND